MSFIPGIVAGIGALSGLFGNRSQTSTQGGTSQSNQGGYSLPLLSPQGQGVLEPLADRYLQMLSTDPNLTGYQASQASGINRQSDISANNIQENAAAHGVFGPAVNTALAGNEQNRGVQINQLNSQIPLLQNQLQQQMINTGANLFGKIPEGTQNVGYQNTAQQGNVTQPGNLLGGLFGNLGPLISALAGMNSGGGGGSAATNTTGGVGNIYS